MNINVTVNVACAEFEGKKMKVGPSIATARVGMIPTTPQFSKEENLRGNRIR